MKDVTVFVATLNTHFMMQPQSILKFILESIS